MDNNQSFSYTYSAQQQETVKKIREKYIPKEENKIEQLIRLDRTVASKATAVSLVVGTIGALVMGTGMSMTMVWTDTLLVQGIIIGIIGMAGVIAAFPVYKAVATKQKQKLAPQIMQLTDEILNNR